MVKKIVLWTAYALIVGVLIFGAANRTLAKTGQGLLFGSPEVLTGTGQGRGGEGNLKQANEFVNAEHEENLEEYDWAELFGSIIEIDSRSLKILTDREGEMELSGRAWRYILETGYIPTLASEVWLSGFYENGEYKIASFQDLSSGRVVMVRDVSGQPLWR